MTERVIVVTPPDDVPLKDGIRILCADLAHEQTQVVSDAVKCLNIKDTVILYVWRSDNSVDWLIDKKQKAQTVLFNAESENQLIAGYLAAQPISYYFGRLKGLDVTNRFVLYNTDQLINILEDTVKYYEKR